VGGEHWAVVGSVVDAVLVVVDGCDTGVLGLCRFGVGGGIRGGGVGGGGQGQDGRGDEDLEEGGKGSGLSSVGWEQERNVVCFKHCTETQVLFSFTQR
jgi:hypothetical protein